MGAAWRDVPRGPQFERVLEMVRGVRALGLEACCTLGMLKQDQAGALAEAGLTAYNHNLDTSPEFYGSIITTRTYRERLDTLARVRQAGITVCSGGIIGLGIGSFLAKSAGFTGATLILLALIAIGLSLFAGISWVEAIERIGAGIELIWQMARQRWQDRQDRKEFKDRKVNED